MAAPIASEAMMPRVRRYAALGCYLTRMEFERRFAGSIGGGLWLFVSPLLMILVIWSALYFGLGMRGPQGSDYGAGLAVALAGWLVFAEAINAALPSIVASPHLVKKVVFPVALLPLAPVMAVFLVHMLVMVAICLVLLVQGHGIGVSILWLPFWMLCLLLVTSAAALAVAGANVVLRDMSALVPNAIALLFWITPIIWPLGNVPQRWQWLARLNPLGIILDGYRHAVLGSPAPLGVGAAWVFLLALLVFGLAVLFVFERLRRWFANVL